jgi:hypothetical protein
VKTFGSMGALAEHLVTRIPAIAASLERGLEQALVKIENTAKAEFGSYQPAVGPFPEWPELAEATKDDRVQQGFSENDPLLRSGAQRDSIEHERQGLEGVVGSTDAKMVFSEFGTPTEPARPVLGPAAFLNREALQKLVGAAVVSGLVGSEQIHKALGYELSTED